MKHCDHCGQDKDLTEFFRALSTPDGYAPICKGCTLQLEAERTKPPSAMFGQES